MMYTKLNLTWMLSLAVLALCLGALYLNAPSDEHGGDSGWELNRALDDGQLVESEAPDAAAYSEDQVRRVVLWMDDNMQCLLELRDPRTFSYVLRENDPNVLGSTMDYEKSVRITTAYDILDAAGGLGPREWVLYGQGADGGVVIERFEMPLSVGGFSVADPTPETLSEAMSWSIAGGTYVPLPQRAPLEQPSRSPVYRGYGLGLNLVMACDPLGRWLYVVDRGADSLSAIDFDTGSVTPVDLVGDSGIGADLIEFRVQEHVAEGLKIRARVRGLTPTDVLYWVYSDYDADGLPDDFLAMTPQVYEQFGYPGVWVSDFVRNLSWYPPE